MAAILTHLVLILTAIGMFVQALIESPDNAFLTPAVRSGFAAAGIIISALLPALQKLLAGLPADATKAAKKAPPFLALLLVLGALGASQSACKNPISPSDVHTILTAEQVACAIAADFLDTGDAQSVAAFCGYAGPITQDVIDIVNSLIAARPMVAVDPVYKANLKMKYGTIRRKGLAQ